MNSPNDYLFRAAGMDETNEHVRCRLTTKQYRVAQEFCEAGLLEFIDRRDVPRILQMLRNGLANYDCAGKQPRGRKETLEACHTITKVAPVNPTTLNDRDKDQIRALIDLFEKHGTRGIRMSRVLPEISTEFEQAPAKMPKRKPRVVS
jgi:hypothetical protein